jgi:CRISPR system Cascade subunit CasA
MHHKDRGRDRVNSAIRHESSWLIFIVRRNISASERAMKAALVLPVTILLLAGCVRYEAKPLLPAATLASFESRTIDDPALGERVIQRFPALADPWPPSRWDRAHLLAVAIANSTDLAIAQADLDAAIAQESIAGMRANPDLSLQTEYARRERSQWLYGLGLDIPLGSSARRRLDRQIAGTRTTIARTQVLARTWTLRSELAKVLSDREVARRRLGMLGDLVTLQKQRVALAGQRIAAGEDAAIDALPAREALLHSEAQLADATADAARAQSALAQVLGLPRNAVATLDIDWADWGEPPALDETGFAREREQALLARSDLAIAINDYAITELDVQHAIARQYPEFVLSPGYVWDHGIAKLPLALGFTLPRLDRNRAEIATMLAARENAGQHLLAIQTRIHGEIDAARQAETIARANGTTAQHRVAEVDEQVRQRTLALRLGAIDRGDALAADILAREAALDALQRLSEQQAARLALEDALHVPLSGPELALPSYSAESGVAR